MPASQVLAKNAVARLVPAALSLVLSIPISAAGIYTWIDANGDKHFSDTPPTDAAYESVEVKEMPVPEVSPGQAPDGRIIRLREEDEALGQRLKQKRQTRLEEKDAKKQQRLEQARRCAVAQQEHARLTNRRLVYGPDTLRRKYSKTLVVDEPLDRSYPKDTKTQQKVRYFDQEITENCGNTREAVKRQTRAGEELYTCPELKRILERQGRQSTDLRGNFHGIEYPVAQNHYNTYCK